MDAASLARAGEAGSQPGSCPRTPCQLAGTAASSLATGWTRSQLTSRGRRRREHLKVLPCAGISRCYGGTATAGWSADGAHVTGLRTSVAGSLPHEVLRRDNPCGTRARKLRIRSLTPCPRGRGGCCLWTAGQGSPPSSVGGMITQAKKAAPNPRAHCPGTRFRPAPGYSWTLLLPTLRRAPRTVEQDQACTA